MRRVGKPVWIVDIEITKNESTVLDRWSNRSSWLVELGERYRVQMNFEVLGRETFIQMS